MGAALHYAALLLAVSLAAKGIGANELSAAAMSGARLLSWLFLILFAASMALAIVESCRRSRQPGAAEAYTKEDEMDWDRIAGNWKQFSGRLREQWGKLTDDDIAQMDGSREQLEGKIQERYGYGKDQARQEIDNWTRRLG